MPDRDLLVAPRKAELFKALGHPLRVRILEQLVVGERSVGALAEALDTELAAVSQQLAVLRRAGVVDARREASTVQYSLRDSDLAELLAVARRLIVRDLRSAGDLLAEIEPADDDR